jgi:hypothetical protein
MKFADRITPYIINRAVGMEFDDSDEAYEYYNLYSWECGFGIRWGKKRWSKNKKARKLHGDKPYRLGQEFYCSYRVRCVAFTLRKYAYGCFFSFIYFGTIGNMCFFVLPMFIKLKNNQMRCRCEDHFLKNKLPSYAKAASDNRPWMDSGGAYSRT